MNILKIKHLSKSYKQIKAVDDISFTVKEGTIFGILGPNGAGKSTTLECITGLQTDYSGDIELLGMNPKTVGKKIYDQIGVQLQETVFQDKIKVRELFQLFSSMYDSPVPYLPLLEQFDIQHKLNEYVTNLSGGQRQKVAICLALLNDPKVVFLDELTTGLDPKARRDMWACIKALKSEGKTVILTTHYMEEAKELCDSICIIDSGKIIAQNTVEGMMQSVGLDLELSFESSWTAEDLKGNLAKIGLPHESVQSSDSELVTKSQSYRIAVKNDKHILDVLSHLHQHQVPLTNLNIERPTLEDIYLHFTGKQWKEA